MPATISLLLLRAVSVASAPYSGGSDTAEDPFRIAAAEDHIALGKTPEDCDKNFILTADIICYDPWTSQMTEGETRCTRARDPDASRSQGATAGNLLPER
jgi:hypothetical protein